MAVTLWLDGQILARAFEIRQPQPIVDGILALAQKVLAEPDEGRVPTMEEWPRVKVGVAVLHGLLEAQSDQEVGAGQAVVVLEGFTIGVGLPKDMPSRYQSSDLLSKACQMAGLRPNAWLLPEKVTIFAALVDEMVE
jgi:AMMECR1 domain-containing protein